MSIMCDCLAVCIPPARDLAETVRCIAQCTYLSTEGCMTVRHSNNTILSVALWVYL